MQPVSGSVKWIAGGVAVALAVASGVFAWTGGGITARALTAELARSRALGLPLEPAAFNLPTPPMAQNAAPGLLALGQQLSAKSGAGTPVGITPLLHPTDVAAADAYLEQLQPEIERAMRLSLRPVCVYAHDYRNGVSELYPELAPHRDIVRLVSMDAVRRARHGDPKGAFLRLNAAARLCRFLNDSNPSVNGALMRNLADSIVIRAVQRSLTHAGATAANLDRAQAVLDELGPPPNVQAAIKGEFAATRATIDLLLADDHAMDGTVGIANRTDVRQVGNQMGIPFLRDRMQTAYYRRFNDLYTQVSSDPARWKSGLVALRITARDFTNDESAEGRLARLFTPFYFELFTSAARNLAERRTLRCLIAALRTPSSTLPDLGDDALDPYTERPFEFTRVGNRVAVMCADPIPPSSPSVIRTPQTIGARYPWVRPEGIGPFPAPPAMNMATVSR